MDKIYIVGAGSLCRFVIDILESNHHNIGGVFDDNYPSYSKVLGYPIIGRIDDISVNAHKNLIIAVGEPLNRREMMEKYHKDGHTFPNAIHRKSYISPHATVENGVIIGVNTTILPETTIHAGCCVLANTTINQNVTLKEYCLVGAGVNIGNNVDIGIGCHLSLAQVIPPNTTLSEWTYVQ